jgi:hypothetical protein
MATEPRKLENALPKQQRLQAVDCLRTLERRDNSIKRYLKPVSADSAVFQLRQFLSASEL